MQQETNFPMELHTLGEYIRHRRKALAISQEALASSLGIGLTTLAGIEAGTRNVTLYNIEKIFFGLFSLESSASKDKSLPRR